MPSHDLGPQLGLLRRQYLQLFEPAFLAWPPSSFLMADDVQSWLFRNLFDPTRNERLPPASYRLNVLQLLVTKIEKASRSGPNEPVLDRLVSQLDTLRANSSSSNGAKETFVTFTCLPEEYNPSDPEAEEPVVTLLERPDLVKGSQVTGYRTWEGSLHLAAYLLTKAGSNLVRNKRILELGSGAGFLSILCSRHLQARHVTGTDGDEGVVDTLKANLALNGISDEKLASARILKWGDLSLEGTWVEWESSSSPYDVIIGADITYHADAVVALAFTLRNLFAMRPQLLVIIGAVVRKADTFELFQSECRKYQLKIAEIDFKPKSMREQKSLFYAAAVPMKILAITLSN